jgi:prophage tail gpP-like protein
VLGRNVVRADVDYRSEDRFRRYVVVSQVPGTDAASGKATRIRAEATDEGVRRSDRVLLIQAESGVSTSYARRRADWEARIRAARSEQVTAIVRGWRQQSGDLWPINALCEAVIPAIGVNGTMLISSLSFKVDDQGELTQITLVRPDAFQPDPQAIVDKSTGIKWKELAGGV